MLPYGRCRLFLSSKSSSALPMEKYRGFKGGKSVYSAQQVYQKDSLGNGDPTACGISVNFIRTSMTLPVTQGLLLKHTETPPSNSLFSWGRW
jgi:hypothetical protein